MKQARASDVTLSVASGLIMLVIMNLVSRANREPDNRADKISHRKITAPPYLQQRKPSAAAINASIGSHVIPRLRAEINIGPACRDGGRRGGIARRARHQPATDRHLEPSFTLLMAMRPNLWPGEYHSRDREHGGKWRAPVLIIGARRGMRERSARLTTINSVPVKHPCLRANDNSKRQ